MLSCFKTCETCPVEITRAHAREHLTRARARCASKDRRAREVREQGARALCARWSARIRARTSDARARANKLTKSTFGELICARGELICARACRTDARARTRAHLGLACAPRARACLPSRVSRARACLCLRTSRACVKCSRACARMISTGNVSYVLKNDKIYPNSEADLEVSGESWGYRMGPQFVG